MTVWSQPTVTSKGKTGPVEAEGGSNLGLPEWPLPPLQEILRAGQPVPGTSEDPKAPRVFSPKKKAQFAGEQGRRFAE